jgi:hypothetical protein
MPVVTRSMSKKMCKDNNLSNNCKKIKMLLEKMKDTTDKSSKIMNMIEIYELIDKDINLFYNYPQFMAVVYNKANELLKELTIGTTQINPNLLKRANSQLLKAKTKAEQYLIELKQERPYIINMQNEYYIKAYENINTQGNSL